MSEQRFTGKLATLSVGGVRIYKSKISAKINTKLADVTDDANYDPATDMIYTAQLKVAVGVELSVEGYYRKDSTPSTVIASAFDGSTGPKAVAFAVGTGYSHFSGNYDLSDLSIDAPVDDVVKISFTLKSNGIVTPNA